MTQSEMYSSRPCRDKVACPRSPVMTAVRFFSLSHRKRRRNSDRSTPSLSRSGRNTSGLNAVDEDLVSRSSNSTRRMHPTVDEQGFQIVPSPVSSITLGPVEDMIDHQFLAPDQVSQIGNPSEATLPAAVFFRGFLKGKTTAGLPEFRGATDEELQTEHRLAATRAAANQRGSALRKTAERDFVASSGEFRSDISECWRRDGCSRMPGILVCGSHCAYAQWQTGGHPVLGNEISNLPAQKRL